MPHLIILSGFVAATLGALIFTVAARSIPALRPLFPYVWRTWLWGTLGFALANAMYAAILIWIIDVVPPPRDATEGVKLWDVAVVGYILLGPFVASAFGAFTGSVFGLYLGWRKGQTAPERRV